MGIKPKKNNSRRKHENKKRKSKKSNDKGKIQKLKQPSKPPVINTEDNESENDGEDMLEMVEDDDLTFLKNAIASDSYRIYDKVKHNRSSKKALKATNEEDDQMERDYEANVDEEVNITKNLLPIKTKHGIVPQKLLIDKAEDDARLQETSDDKLEEETMEYVFEDETSDTPELITSVQLLAEREKVLKEKKLHIGTLSAGVLENPEEKVTNLKSLLKIMAEGSPEVYMTVRKLATVSLLEIFKDLLPSYQIKDKNTEGVLLKKDTLKLQKYEETLLLYYKKYLQQLESYSLMLRKKNTSKSQTQGERKLAEVCVHALCELLETHPYFNYGENIAQVVVLCLNNPQKHIRSRVKASLNSLFTTDLKGEITLHVLRSINNYLKTHTTNINVEMLEVLLCLKLQNVDLDAEKQQDLKQKKLMSHKANVLSLSKKERKRKKKLKQLEQELLETKADENKQKKQQILTEITKIVFNIYFRVLKNSSSTNILGVCLEGLAKFSHCINVEYYIDLVNVLDSLLKEEWLALREKLHCTQTVFAILSGQGEALNIDPTRFYNHLYNNLFLTCLENNESECFKIALKALNDSLLKRRKKITNKRLVGFVKRICTLSLHLRHNETLSSLAIIKSMMQVNRSVDILLDLENSLGDGNYQPEVDDAEYANASSTALYETRLLSRHYHPVVSKYSKYIAAGVPLSGEANLSMEISKLSPEQLYAEYDASKMAFNPTIPVPKKVPVKRKINNNLQFVCSDFQSYCNKKMRLQLTEAVFCE